MTKEKETVRQQAAAPARKPEAVVYCGPSVRGIAKQYTVYNNGTPKALDDFIKAHPAAGNLLVPTKNFANMRRALEKKGSPENIIFESVKMELK